MNIEAKGFKIEMSYDELENTTYDAKWALEVRIKEHWAFHQQNWKKHEEDRLYRLKTFCTHIGKPGIYTDLLLFADDTFAKHNKEHNIS